MVNDNSDLLFKKSDIVCGSSNFPAPNFIKKIFPSKIYVCLIKNETQQDKFFKVFLSNRKYIRKYINILENIFTR